MILRLLTILQYSLLITVITAKRHPCHITKRQIVDTLSSGDVMVTATVRQITIHPETLKPEAAILKVRRVYKGHAFVDGKREVAVTGFATLKHCRRRLTTKDTKVFALNLENDKFVVKEPPLPITLHVLDALHGIAINRTVKKRRRVKLNLCEQKSCPSGSKCVPSTGECLCRPGCKRPGPPVCGSDHVTYASHCHLSVRTCLLKEKGLELRIKAFGPCEKKNPCDDLRCGPGEECVVTQKGGVLSASCTCPTKCTNYGDSVQSSPVCSARGEDFPSICHMRKHACETKLNITVKFYGKCDPCKDFKCSPGTVCKVGEYRRPECRCSQQCSLDHDPVCATDGNTYENECVMRVAACKEDRQLEVYKKGVCKEVGNPCSSLKCWPGESCEINKSGKASCKCTEKCPNVLKPVCGVDGITYDNECELQRLACTKRRRNHVRHEGTCGVGVCATYTECKPPQVCVPQADRPHCVCPQCGDELREVCGSDGQTYPNECKMRQKACWTGQNVYVKYRGICEGCEKQSNKCEFYSVCVSDGKGNGKCECANDCPMNASIVATHKRHSYVCGTDGVTYSSECHLRKSACNQRKFIVVAFAGKCDACVNVECRYGEECRGGQCVCNYACQSDPPEYAKICGEDGVLYLSECHIQLASCKKGSPIHEVPVTHCHSANQQFSVRSFNCSNAVCSFGAQCISSIECICPMSCLKQKRPVCGSDGIVYFNQCHMNLVSCIDQREIFAEPMLGNCYKSNDSCQCNRIGSYGPTCGPSGQCRCRPGVGGTKCDHCLPGFWGIHLIARGAMSCTPCGCSAFGSSRADCEQSTGRCECLPGVKGDKCEQCDPGFILTATGCKKALEYRTPRTCSEHKCHHGAKCVPQSAHIPDCICPAECDASKMGIAANMTVCGTDGSTYDNYCQLKQFACKHQIDLVTASLGICEKDSMTAPVDRTHRQKTLPPNILNKEHKERSVKLGGFCTFDWECIPEGSECRTQPGRHGQCQCGPDTIEHKGVCQQESQDKLQIAFNGRNEARVAVIGQKTNMNFTITFTPTSSNGVVFYARDANNQEIALKVEQRRIVLEIGKETLHSRDVVELNNRLTVSVSWRHALCTLTVGEGLVTARMDIEIQSITEMIIGGTGNAAIGGFSGCIHSLIVNEKSYTRKDLVSSEDLCECGESCNAVNHSAGPVPPPGRSAVLSTVEFNGNAHIAFPNVKMDVRNSVLVEVRVRPRSADGLVFFWGSQKNGVASGDFLALYLVASQPHFFWNLGSGIAYVKAGVISNHKWSTVSFGRDLRNGTIQVDGGFIAAQESLPKNQHLDISGETVYLGGTPSDQLIPSKLRALNQTFEGAVQFLSINEKVFNLGQESFWDNDVSLYKGQPCGPAVNCGGHGICIPRADKYTCKCDEGFTGDNCESEGKSPAFAAVRLDGKIEYAYLNQGFNSTDSSKSSVLSISFKTSQLQGVLLWEGPWSQRGEGDFLVLYLRAGHLYFGVNLGNDLKIKSVAVDGFVSDGKWHRITVERLERRVKLSLDEVPDIKLLTTPGSTELNSNGLVYVGGRQSLPSTIPVREPFIGCVKNLLINEYQMSLRDDSIGLQLPQLCHERL